MNTPGLHSHRLVKQLILAAVIAVQFQPQAQSAGVLVRRVPDNGLQPVLAGDPQSGVHLLYFTRDPEDESAGHFIYRHYLEAGDDWDGPVQVSHELYPLPHLIARAAMVVDDEQRIHVTWHRDFPLQIPDDVAWETIKPEYFYTRSGAGDTRFETERSVVDNFVTATAEAGAGLAIQGGKISLVWHGGNAEDGEIDESHRSIYRVGSMDHGANFGRPELAGDPRAGACGCCGLSAAYAADGRLQVVFRSAVANSGRHTQLLEWSAPGQAPALTRLHDWELNACPVSTNAVNHGADGSNYTVFETKGQIYMARLDAVAPAVTAISGGQGQGANKHPALAFNRQGDYLVAWNEGRGTNGGGALRWHLYGNNGDLLQSGDQDARVPDDSAPAVIALKNEDFLLLY